MAALFDFGLTPRHLRNSLRTMTTYEQPYPETSGLLAAFADSISAGAADPGQARSNPLPPRLLPAASPGLPFSG